MGGLSTLSFEASRTRRRLLVLSLLSITALAACDNGPRQPTSAPRERSQAVQAATPAPASSTTAAVVSAVAPPPTQPKKLRGPLCQLESAEGKALPKKHISRAGTESSKSLPENLSATSGSWTWVNFWAAWCAPCKEEIPRLTRWQQRLTQGGARFRLAFISLDDDERQLQQFLSASSDLHVTYWLKEGKEREEWMKAAGLDADPELPIHLLVDPRGRVRCRIQGAVEDSDYPQVQVVVSSSSAP